MYFRLTLGALLLAAVPTMAQAQFGPRPGCGCRGPQPVPVMMPAPVVVPVRHVAPVCCTPQPIITQQLRPVVETQYRQQQITTYQDVVRTQIRQEQQIVNVPVTTTRQVTVDQGAYKMVWVPNVVTKNVQETVIQQQVQQRDVPYQVVERIPQVRTQIIPQQTVRYVPEYRTVYGTTAGPFSAATIAEVPVAQPQLAEAAPTTAPAASAPPQTAEGGEWKPIPQRQAAAEPTIEQQSFETAQQAPTVEPNRLFSSPPTPTAVNVFRSMIR